MVRYVYGFTVGGRDMADLLGGKTAEAVPGEQGRAGGRWTRSPRI